jgi:hypothetical protein
VKPALSRLKVSIAPFVPRMIKALNFLLQFEPVIRPRFFFAVSGIMAIWEAVLPCQLRSVCRRVRWPYNLAIAALNNLLLRLLYPASSKPGWSLRNTGSSRPRCPYSTGFIRVTQRTAGTFNPRLVKRIGIRHFNAFIGLLLGQVSSVMQLN